MTTVNTGGGAEVSGDVNTGGGDFVGRDKIIQNIVIVGQLLDYAEMRKLLPDLPDIPHFESIDAAFEATFERPARDGLDRATAVAGEMMKDVLAKWEPSGPFSAIPYRRLLREIAPDIVKKLQQLNYWETFYETVYRIDVLGSGIFVRGQVIWLPSLGDLWSKHVGLETKMLFGIAEIEYQSAKIPVFVVKCEDKIETAWSVDVLVSADRNSCFGRMGSAEFQVFITGLIIDLIRLSSSVLSDRQFWNRINDWLVQQNG